MKSDNFFLFWVFIVWMSGLAIGIILAKNPVNAFEGIAIGAISTFILGTGGVLIKRKIER